MFSYAPMPCWKRDKIKHSIANEIIFYYKKEYFIHEHKRCWHSRKQKKMHNV